MKTAVDKVKKGKKGKARIVNTRFAAMASHYLFDSKRPANTVFPNWKDLGTMRG